MKDIFKSDATVIAEGDNLPPEGGFGPVPTGLYPVTIKVAYVEQSKGGAYGLNLHMKNADGTGNVIKQTLWMTSGRAKGQLNYYVDGQGVRRKLPGMDRADQLHELLTDKPFSEHETEKKVVKLWNYEAGGEVNTEVDAVPALMDKPILVGLTVLRENKGRQDSNGVYQQTNEAREKNEIEKFFDPDGRTLIERKENSEAKFIEKWKKRFPADYVRDKFKPVEGAPEAPSATTEEINSLFGKK